MQIQMCTRNVSFYIMHNCTRITFEKVFLQQMNDLESRRWSLEIALFNNAASDL